MRSSGVDELKTALRRSAWLLIMLPILGALAITAVNQLQSPEHRATAKVVLPQAELAATLAGIQPVYVDPDRQDEAERNLARAPGLYARAASAVEGRLGNGRYLRSVTAVSVSNNLVVFRSTTDDEARSVAIANAVARAYPEWRAAAYVRTIDAAIQQIRAQLRRSGSDSGGLEEQLQRLNVLKTLNSGNSLIVEPTDGAELISPRPVRDAVLGGAIGFVIALLIAGLRELLDTRIRSEADVEEVLDAPVLASVRTIPRRARNRTVITDPRFADTYGLLAANLVQILEGREGALYVAVTSAEPGEGKTTTSANLALALARRGQRVVLADFDLRKPALASLFAMPSDVDGVADVLSGDAALTNTLAPITVGPIGTGRARPRTATKARAGEAVSVTASLDGEGSLQLLPAGHVRTARAGAEFSRLPALLEALEPHAEFVIIDTPPALLTAGVAELAQSVTAVLVVVRQGVATKRRLHALGSRSQIWRSKIVGAVLNDVSREEHYSGYYGTA